MNRGKLGYIEAVLIAGIVVSAVFALFFHYRNTEQQRTDDWIRRIASGEETDQRETGFDHERVRVLTSEEPGIPQSYAVSNDPVSRKIDFAALLEINPDIIAWIYIPGTDIDYPVFCAPEGMDEDHYLRRDIKGRYNSHGGIYVRRSEIAEDGSIKIIYGHNMRDGTMFASLTNTEIGELFLYTPTDERRYLHEKKEIRDPEDVYLASAPYDLTLCTCTSDGSCRYLAHFALSPPAPSDPFKGSS